MNCTIEELHSAGMKSTFPYGKLAKSSSLAFYTGGHLQCLSHPICTRGISRFYLVSLVVRWPFSAMSEESPSGTPGGHQFPGHLVKAALLSRLNSDVAVSLVPGESTMSAVLGVVRTPAADAVVAKVSKENEVCMITSNDEEESVSSTLPHGQIVHSSPEIMDSQDDIFSSMSPVGGEDGAVLNSQGDGAGQQARTRAQPSGTGHQGQSLRATQPTGQQAVHALPARQPVNPNPLLNKGWEDVAMRMATISLQAAGRPYKRTHIEHALVNTGMDCSTIVTLGEFDNNFKYQVTFTRKEIADYFVREFPVLSISTGKGTYNCPVSSFLRREYRVKVAWFPDVERKHIEKLFKIRLRRQGYRNQDFLSRDKRVKRDVAEPKKYVRLLGNRTYGINAMAKKVINKYKCRGHNVQVIYKNQRKLKEILLTKYRLHKKIGSYMDRLNVR